MFYFLSKNLEDLDKLKLRGLTTRFKFPFILYFFNPYVPLSPILSSYPPSKSSHMSIFCFIHIVREQPSISRFLGPEVGSFEDFSVVKKEVKVKRNENKMNNS